MKSGYDSALLFIKEAFDMNPGLVLEASGHSGYDEKNQFLLSQQRAVAVCDSLFALGVPKNSILPMGHGSKKLLISKSQVDKLKTKEEKEAATAYNRRCTFKVLKFDTTSSENSPPKTTEGK